MNSKILLNELVKTYNLKKNYNDILSCLLKKNLTAEEILDRTTVSSGRIYQLLKELENLNLIDKISGKPNIYSCKDFPDKIRQFLEHKFNISTRKQTLIQNKINDFRTSPEITVIDARKKFDYELKRLYTPAKWLKVSHQHKTLVWFLYIWDESLFFTVRNALLNIRPIASLPYKKNLLAKRKLYMQLYNQIPVSQIMSLESFEQFLTILNKNYDKNKRIELLESLLRKLENKTNVELKILENSTIPSSTYITDREAMRTFHFSEKDHKIIKFKGQSIIKTFVDEYEEYKKYTKSLKTYLENEL